MHLKIRCDEESEKFCKIFWELNKAQERHPTEYGSKLGKLHTHFEIELRT